MRLASCLLPESPGVCSLHWVTPLSCGAQDDPAQHAGLLSVLLLAGQQRHQAAVPDQKRLLGLHHLLGSTC